MLQTLRSLFDPPITADAEQSTAKLAWVVRLRWVAITAQLLSIIPALEFEVLDDSSPINVVQGFGVGDPTYWLAPRPSLLVP